MKYNIVFIPDIHWGVIDPEKQWKYLYFITDFLHQATDSGVPIDLIVIAGDYFDSKLPLNSREAILAIRWFNELLIIANQHGVKAIRVFKGTPEHDNDQLDAFQSIQSDGIDLKIFNKTTLEETLPSLSCVYCPDEQLQSDIYEETYVNEMICLHDIAFFHGSFDVVYGSLLESNPSLSQQKNVIFPYNKWNHVTYGPLLAGHWHDGKQYNDLYYAGSPFRFKFNEMEEKGFLFTSYDTEEKKYFVRKILNPVTPIYVTYDVYSISCSKEEEYAEIIRQVEETYAKFQEPPYVYADNRIRIMFYIVDDKPENDITISAFRKQFLNRKQIKIVVKDKLKEKRKKETSRKTKEREEAFQFIHETKKSKPEIIHQFIHEVNGDVNVPLEYIQKKYSEYIKK